MIDYLAGHPRYHTLHAWNRSTSYAQCIKAQRLGLDEDAMQTVLEMLDVPEAFEAFSEVLEEFAKQAAEVEDVLKEQRAERRRIEEVSLHRMSARILIRSKLFPETRLRIHFSSTRAGEPVTGPVVAVLKGEGVVVQRTRRG